MYHIGMYKNGQQIANSVFSSNDLNATKSEFERMFNATIEECFQDAIDFGWDEGTVNDITFPQAWDHKHFNEDVNNVAVFESAEDKELHTNYTYQGCESNQM